jgi:hypothetical protein
LGSDEISSRRAGSSQEDQAVTQTDIYKRGLAIGRSDIINDRWHFRFYEEVFTVTLHKLKTRKFRGYIVAKVEDVRKYG